MEDKILARATIGLPGLPLGREALVDPSDPYIADCLARGYLVVVAEESEAESADEETVAETETEAAPPPAQDEPAEPPAE